MQQNDLTLSNEPQYPLLTERVQSTFIDALLMVILTFIAASVLDKIENVPNWVRIVLFVMLWFIYEPLFTSRGATLGNWVIKIRVRQNGNSGSKINFFQALVRYAIKILLGWLSFLTMHTNKTRRAMHDYAAGSVVIKKV